eukprot:242796-Rhodomonas_salina.1
MDEEGAQMWSMKLGNEGMKLELQGDLSGMDEEKAAVAIQSGMQGMMEREALRKKARQRADSPRPDEMGHVGAPPEQTAAEQPAANQDETSEGQAATAGPPVAEEKAVLTIQSGLRGMRDRKSARSLRADEEGMRKEQEEMLDAMMLEEQRMMEAQMFQGQRLGSEALSSGWREVDGGCGFRREQRVPVPVHVDRAAFSQPGARDPFALESRVLTLTRGLAAAEANGADPNGAVLLLVLLTLVPVLGGLGRGERDLLGVPPRLCGHRDLGTH